MAFSISSRAAGLIISVEDNTSIPAVQVNGTAGAIVLAANKGPLVPTLVQSGADYVSKFGNADPTVSPAHDAALEFLNSAPLYVQRVVNNAQYSGITYHLDAEPSVSVAATKIYRKSWSTSMLTNSDYSTGARQLVLIKLSSKLVTSNTFGLTISDGVSSDQVISRAFASTSNGTLTSIASDIQTSLNTFGSGGVAEVIDSTAGAGIKQQTLITFTGTFDASDTCTITLQNNFTNAAINVAVVTFATTHTAMLDSLVTNINTAFSGAAASRLDAQTILIEAPASGANYFSVTSVVNGGGSTVTSTNSIRQAGTGNYDGRTIRIFSPPGASLTYSAYSVSGGSSQATVTLHDNVKLFDIVAENPGTWGNDIGIQLSNIDTGQKQVITLTASGPLVTGHSFEGTVTYGSNTYTIGPVTYATDSDTTLAAIATAIATVINNNISPIGKSATAVVTTVTGSVTNDRVITVTAPDSLTSVTIAGTISGGATTVSLTIVESISAIATDKSFALDIYSRSNTSAPMENFVVSSFIQTSGLGVQQNVAEVVNTISPSAYVRIYQPTEAIGLPVEFEDTNPQYLGGGTNGTTVTNNQIIAGWDVFLNRAYNVNLLINGGYTDLSVQKKIITVATTRRDAFYILDMPSIKQSQADAIIYRKQTLNISNSYGLIASPDYQIIDTVSGIYRYAPPSGAVASLFAANDTRYGIVSRSPAGITNGVITNAVKLRYNYTDYEYETMQNAQVNVIRRHRQGFFYLGGADTLQTRTTALSNASIRRMVSAIEVAIADDLEAVLHSPANAALIDDIEGRIRTIVSNYSGSGRGLQSYSVSVGASNNPQVFIGTVKLVPEYPLLKIVLTLELNNRTVAFGEGTSP